MANPRFKGRDMITLNDYTGEEIWDILHATREMKARFRMGELPQILKGKVVALIFENRSTRTRASFETGVAMLGGYPMYIDIGTTQIARAEPLKDAVRVWDRYVDGIVLRALDPYKGHQRLQEYAHYAGIPVINASTDLSHPCQALADFTTMWEKKGKLEGLKIAYTGIWGHGSGTANEFAVVCPKLGIDFVVAVPKKYAGGNAQIVKAAQENAKALGTKFEITDNLKEAAKGADVMYTDEWAATGFQAEQKERHEAYQGYTVTNAILGAAKPDVIYMHCLPAVRGEEVAEEVLEGPKSVVWDEAENRLHAQNALMGLLLV